MKSEDFGEQDSNMSHQSRKETQRPLDNDRDPIFVNDTLSSDHKVAILWPKVINILRS